MYLITIFNLFRLFCRSATAKYRKRTWSLCQFLMIFSKILEIFIFLTASFYRSLRNEWKHGKALHCRLVSLVGKVPSPLCWRLGFDSGLTNTQGLKIIKEKVLPLQLMVRPSCLPWYGSQTVDPFSRPSIEDLKSTHTHLSQRVG
mgnify:CR=1 FL=1